MIKNVLILLLAGALGLMLWRSETNDHPSEPAKVEETEIQKLLREAEAKPGLAGAAIGFCLLDPSGRVVEDHQAQTAFIPASSLKTVTTATALEKLGPDFQIETTLRSSAAIQNGILSGDVFIIGGGDPMLALDDLKAWAAELKSRGLIRITGRIIGDGRLFRGSIYDDFWNWGDIGNGYGSAVAGLNLEHNRYTATFRAGAAIGDPSEFLGTQPEVPGVGSLDETITGPADSGDGVVIHGGERTHILHFRGTVPLGETAFQVVGAVPDPELFTAHHFKKALLAAGIEVVGDAVSVSDEKPGSHELLKHRSPPLKEIVTSIHASSDNHETECLFRLLGLRENKAPDAVIREHWKARGLDFIGLRMEDGCGLARADFIRPLDLARLQFIAGRGPQGAVYKASLLSKDNLRWKGGAMSGVRSTTGYITTRSGLEYCFAFMANHYSDGQTVAAVRDALIQAVNDL